MIVGRPATLGHWRSQEVDGQDEAQAALPDDGLEEVKRLIRENPWATFVSSTARGLIASHYPVLLAEDCAEIAIISHFGRPDDELHELGSWEMLVIIQGPHDYVSPSWYAPGDVVGTWNHVTAHLYGVPQILSDEENYAMLSRG